MSSDVALKVNNVSKRYEIYSAPHHRLLQTFFHGRRQFFKEFWALKNVSFEVKRGECVGIIGRNGSGKSTLLQVITGTLEPTLGSAEVSGRVSALLELGSGFNPEFTGRENVYMNGAILGISRAEMDKRFDDITAFADIGDFIEQPVKTYSSGMYVRLAFAVAINVDPDILIIDEALAVGDIRFQQKCYRKITSFRDSGKTVIFVSHDVSAVNLFCNRAIWLDQGRIKKEGNPDDVTKEYIAFMAYGLETESPEENKVGDVVNQPQVKISDDIIWEPTDKCPSFGEGGAAILATSLYSKERHEKITAFEGGEEVVYYVKVKAKQRIEQPIIGFIMNDDHGVHILGYNTHNLGLDIAPFAPGEERIFKFGFKFPQFKPGNYLFSPAIADGTQLMHMQHHWVYDAYVIQVVNNAEIANIGCCLIPEKVSIIQDV